MAGNESKLSLVIKAIDQASGPLREVSKQIAATTAPFKQLGASIGALAHDSGLTKVGHSFQHVGHAAKEVGAEALELGKKFLEMEVVGAFALYELTKGSIEAGAQLAQMAARVGLGVDAYAQLQYAAGQAHISAEEFNSAMSQFTKRLGEAKAGGGPLLAFLEKVSPVLATQVKHSKSVNEALELMEGAFVKVTDPAKRAALSTEAFGRGSYELGQFLGQGNKKIAETGAEFLKLTGPQAEFAERAEEAEKASKKLGVSFLGLRNSAMSELLPVFTELTEAVTEFVSANREGLQQWAKETGAEIKKWIDGGGLTRLVDGIKDLGHTVKGVVDSIGGMKGVLIGVGLVMSSGLIGSVFTLVVAVAQLGLALGISGITMIAAIGTMALFAMAAVSIGAAAYEIYENWDDLKFLFKDFWQSITFYATRAWEKIEPIIEGVKGAATEIFGHPLDALKTAGKFYFGGSSDPQVRLGAERAAPTSSNARGGETKISVDFNNMPRGSQVSQQSTGNQSVDVSRGVSMAPQ